MSIIYNSVLSDTFTHDYMINVNDEVVIWIYDGETDEDIIPENIQAHGNKYELRFMALTEDLEDGNFKWDGKFSAGMEIHYINPGGSSIVIKKYF